MSEWWSGTTLSLYVKKDEYNKYYGKEHGYLIMNHSYEIDWLMGWQFCDGLGVLGNCKAYAKKAIQYMPPIGWMWKFSEFVFLERSFEKDKEIIKTQISELCDYPDPVWLLMTPEGTRYTPTKHEASLKFAKEKNLPLLKHHLTPRTRGFTTSLQYFSNTIYAAYRLDSSSSWKDPSKKDKEIIKTQISELCDYPDPVWLLMTPEGTRYTPTKHEASLKFAKEKNLPLLKHHLTPRTRGFTTSLQYFRGKIPAIYNIQLAFERNSKPPPTLLSLLYGKPVHAHLYIQRIPVEDVPEDEAEASKWLHDLFVVKDKMQDSFLNTGDFFTESGVERIESFQVPPRVYSLINTLGWAILTLTPMLYYLIGLLFSGRLLHLTIGGAILAAFYILLQKSIGITQISQGSSYGTEKK
ncbi:1-acyl-sn-glycerol-3-phosphate acyltransferase gamma [Papilio machaon]|uniref:1-acyl-sn-glycerol-3-phosphate acyltransferase gamma n=1 Tax=Papilio machaon TaxID=76193 RepID=A0A194QWR6_PAPMA|nr:1-acyl-sn-glycerol-3-phosphate acyltransferase gamma [Papilio machaon]